MESPLQTASRLLAALETLSAEETTLIRTMDFVEATAVRERAAPLVERLCELAAEPAVQSLRPQVTTLLERSAQNFHFLNAQLTRLNEELTRVTEARHRLRRVAPVYKIASRPTESRLNTAA